jgi:hypothetical protein
MVHSDEQESDSPRIAKKKPDLRIRKESFASEDSTNESLSSDEHSNLSPRSKLNRELVSDYGRKLESYLKQLEKENSISSDHLAGHEVKA